MHPYNPIPRGVLQRCTARGLLAFLVENYFQSLSKYGLITIFCKLGNPKNLLILLFQSKVTVCILKGTCKDYLILIHLM